MDAYVHATDAYVHATKEKQRETANIFDNTLSKTSHNA